MSIMAHRASALWLVIATVVLAGCSTGGGSTDGFVAPEPGLTLVAPQDRKIAPTVTGTTLAGKPIKPFLRCYPG